MITWRERIVKARARGHFTNEEKALADDWGTCAVGEQAEAHPLVVRYQHGCTCLGPVDNTLYRLGSSTLGFCLAVLVNRFDKADEYLDAIEDRVMVLKREQGA